MNKIQIPVPKPDSNGIVTLTSSAISMQSHKKLRISIGHSRFFSITRSLGYFGTLLFIMLRIWVGRTLLMLCFILVNRVVMNMFLQLGIVFSTTCCLVAFCPMIQRLL